MLALKENQSTLFADATALLEPLAHQIEDVLESTHGRSEERRASVVSAAALAKKHGFPGIKAVGRVELRRRVGNTEDPPVVRYFLLSKAFSPTRLLAITRSHWGIENRLHWVLDVQFSEDSNRARKDNAPENLAIVRKLALNILQTMPDKASIRRKIKRAGWDDAFLLQAISHMR